MRNENEQCDQTKNRSQKGSNMFPLGESIALIHDTGRQAGLSRMRFPKVIHSLTKAA